MSIFSKSVYKEIELPFILDVYSNWKQDKDAGIINIEAYGYIDEEYKYCYSSYILKDSAMYDNGDYLQMLELLKNSNEKKVKIRLKYKNSKLTGFKLDITSLVKIYNDERFFKLELTGWGLNDKSSALIDID